MEVLLAPGLWHLIGVAPDQLEEALGQRGSALGRSHGHVRGLEEEVDGHLHVATGPSRERWAFLWLKHRKTHETR